ncbi:uncharacterized protein [Eurosta solidaginis]|uniref:uncharacterized protein isoform X2 n=1 Tax=Eurosta solidaginis TaxID=178769 RepID=UPI003530F643
MENQPPKLQIFKARVGNNLQNYRLKRAPCDLCIQFKEMIETQNQQIAAIMDMQKLSEENMANLQATTESQNKVMLEMMADQKVQLQGFNKTRQGVTDILAAFPLKLHVQKFTLLQFAIILLMQKRN